MPYLHLTPQWAILNTKLAFFLINSVSREGRIAVFRKIGLSLLASAMWLALAAQALAYDVQLQPFKDVKESDYAYTSIHLLSAVGIIAGYSAAEFRPDQPLSREAFIKLLVATAKLDGQGANQAAGAGAGAGATAKRAEARSAGAAQAGVGSATPDLGAGPRDVAETRWSYPYIQAAYAQGWLDFMLDDTGALRPEQPITREEVAALTGRMLLDRQPLEARLDWRQSGWQAERDRAAFADGSRIRGQLAADAYYSVHRGIMIGDAAGFKPQQPLVRKQAAVVLHRLIDEEQGNHELEATGYYAIQSYGAMEHMPLLANVIFGWSHMEYAGPGEAALNTTATEFSVPRGAEEPLAFAESSGAGRELMVFYDKPDLKDFLEDAAARAAFVASLGAWLDQDGAAFTGVSLDFEGLRDASSQAAFSSFVEQVKQRIGERTLSVAVPPSYYYKGYDLQRIGELADTVILMAYDFTHAASFLPSAPLPLVHDTVANALLAVPKEKLVLGISKQANQWIAAPAAASGPVVYKPAIADVEKRAAQAGVERSLAIPFFLTKLSFEDARGNHTIYYEDHASIAYKVWVAKLYGLKGIALWHMGNLTADDWSYIAATLTKALTICEGLCYLLVCCD